MNKIYFLLCAVLLLPCIRSVAQGCSDAGICTMPLLKSGQSITPPSNSNILRIGFAYGSGFQKTGTITPSLEYQRDFSPAFSMSARLTAGFANGFLGNNSGLGDVYLSGAYSAGNTQRIKIIAGVKIPLNDANNKNEEDLPLPMDYQSSLGTVDAIIAIGIKLGSHWDMSGGVQLPLQKRNNNSFLPSLYTDERAEEFAPTNLFQRKPDALLRLNYTYNLNEHWSIRPSLLAIYHMGKDKYISIDGIENNISGSDGLTLNGVVAAAYALNSRSDLELLVASPVVVREVRPDGLTRSLVLSLQYALRF